MIYQEKRSRHIHLGLYDGRPACGDQSCLHVAGRLAVRFMIHAVEDLADHVKARHEVGSADAEEDADLFADLRTQGFLPLRDSLAPLKTTYPGCSLNILSKERFWNPFSSSFPSV